MLLGELACIARSAKLWDDAAGAALIKWLRLGSQQYARLLDRPVWAWT